MPPIAAKAFVAPEFLQAECTPDNLARAITERLDDPALRVRQTAAQTSPAASSSTSCRHSPANRTDTRLATQEIAGLRPKVQDYYVAGVDSKDSTFGTANCWGNK